MQSAGSATTMTFTFRITNPIPQNGKIQITWPSEIQFKESSAIGLVSIVVYGTVNTDFTTTVNQASRQFTFDSMFSLSGLAVDTLDIVIAIQKLNNPESQVTSSSFTITTLDSSGNAIDQTNSGLTISSTSPGVITLQSITPSSTTVDAEITVQMYEITDISTSGAFLRVYWPVEITYVTTGTLTCTMIFGFTANSPPCTADTTNNYLELSFYRNNVHLYNIGTFRNPLGAITTSTWKFQVFDSSSNLIMEQTTGIQYTTTISTITVSSSVRPSGTTQVALVADYNLNFTVSTRLLSDSTIQLIFPIDQVKYNSSTSCFSGTTNLGCTLSDVNVTHFTTTITQWCNPGTECTAGSSVNFTLKNAINPSWVVSPLTSSVMIKTANIQLSGNPIIDEITTGIQFSPTLTPGTLTDITVTKDSTTNKVGEATSYNISFTAVTPIGAGGIIKLTLPTSAVYKAASTEVVCKDSALATLACTSTSDGTNNVQTISVTTA